MAPGRLVMGVRLNMFAVDVPRLSAFLEQPVGAVLWYYVNHAPKGGPDLWLSDERRRYLATPGQGIVCSDGGRRYRLHEEAADDPSLRRTAIEYLQSSS